MKNLFLIACIFFSIQLVAQLSVPQTGSNAYTVCSGTLYDSGGPSFNYSNNSDGYTVLNPSTAGNMVQISGTSSGEDCCDYLRIYNGAGLGGNILWAGTLNIGTIPTITSTDGPLTVQFTSSITTVGSGFSLDINCVSPVILSLPTTGNNAYTVCSGVLYDSGGPSGNYSNNSNGYTVLNPSNPGNMVQVNGFSDGDNCCDFIRIYNGAGLGGNLLWAGNPSIGVIPSITSTAGPLTIEFTSNGSTVGSGFSLDINCLAPQLFTVPQTGSNAYTVCSGTLYDSGGPNYNYSNNSDGYTVLNPSNPGNMVQVSGTSSGEDCCDFIRIYNGVGLGGNLLWAGSPGIGIIPTITSTAGPLTVQFTSGIITVGSGFTLNINCVPPVIFTLPTTGNNSYTVCSGVLYDSGGPSGNYSNNSNGYTVLNPSNPGNMVQVNGFSDGDNCCDFIRIYNGAGLGGNLLWAGNPSIGVIPSITSTAGPLTIEFTSNGSTVGSGFSLDINCLAPQLFTVPQTGSNAYTVCSGTLYDSGGPNYNYSNNSDGYTVLNPSNPGNMVQVSGTSSGEDCCDFIRIYNGVGLGGNLLWAGSPGIGIIPTITSTAGPLTVQFTSGIITVGSGFTLNINCVPPVIFTLPTTGNNSYTVCSGVLYDSGGPSGNYSNNSNGYTVLNPSNPGNMVQVNGFSDGDNCCDFIRIYNGAGLSGNLLWAGNPSTGVIPSITSTAGPLTIEFTSNGSTVGSGFSLDINCLSPQLFTVPQTGNNSYTVCSGTLYDSGGPNYNYSNNSDGYTVLNPSNPGTFLQINGTSSGESCCDAILIYDGAGTGGTLLWSGNPGIGIIPTTTSTTGPLTVRFFSDFATAGPGFTLNISCFDTSSCAPSIVVSSNLGTSICLGQQVTYTAFISNGGLSPSYQWKRNGVNVGTNSSTYTSSAISNGDVITCELTSNATCADSPFATSNALTMVVNSIATPSFTQVPPVCTGSIMLPLPTLSNNLISGTWLPAMNNTATTTYTFTPDANQCGTTTTMTIVVNPITMPSFTQVSGICAGETLLPLPTTSNNGITGTWSPALNNTFTTTYTFTPNGGQCASEGTMTIFVNPNTTPSFTQVPAICAGVSLLPLPTTSNNGISGSWAPALNNATTTTYTFTPAVGQCASTASMTITVNPNITPSFSPVGSYCAGQSISPLPTTSLNGISGSWSPVLNNTITTNYNFTPSGGQCATTTNTIIVINENPTVTLTFDGAILTASAGFTGYVWTLNGNTLADATTNEIVVAQVGLYTVTVTDANGCNASATFEVQTVGLANPSFGNEFSLHPNPSLGITTLTLLCTETQTAHIRVLDLQGKIQFQQTNSFNVGKNEVPLNLSNLADGVYFLQLENSNFKHTKRFVKMRE